MELPVSYNQRTRLATFYGTDSWWRPPVVFALQWDGDPDEPLLRQALDLVVRRHVAVRTYFPGPDGPARCVPAANVEVSFETADLRGLPTDQRAAEWRSQLQRAQAPFDLSRPLLIRGRLSLLDGSAMLAFAADHIVFDGASVPVFLRDFSYVYGALARGREPADLTVTVSDFSRFAAAEQDWIGSAPGAAALEYWKEPWETFGPFPSLPFPRVPEPATTYTWQRAFSARAYAAFRARAQALRVSPFMLGVGAMNWALREHFRTEASAMVVMNSRRQAPESARGVGNYATKLLLATDLAGRPSFEDCVGAVRTRVIEAVRHGMMPYELLTERICPSKAGARPDSPYLAFNMSAADESYRLGDHLASVTAPDMDDAYAGMSPALFVNIDPHSDGTAALVAGYHHARFDTAAVDEFMTGTYARMLS